MTQTDEPSVRTKQILQKREDYIGWRTMTLLKLKANQLAKDLEGNPVEGKENEALIFILESISFTILSGIPPDHLNSAKSVLGFLQTRFGDNNIHDLALSYRKTKMMGIYPQSFINKLDIARSKVIQAGGKISIEGQLDIIFENIHQEFYGDWIRDRRLNLPAIITQNTIEELLKSLKQYYDASPPVLRAKYDYQKFKANAVEYKESSKKERPKCKHCGKLGHQEHQCWKLHPNLNPNIKDQDENKVVDAYFDSCANKHFFKDSPADLKPTNAIVYTADGTSNPIYSYGKIKIGEIYVDNVFHQPKFEKNLVSGIELMKEGFKITMENDSLKVEKEGQTYATGSYDPKEDLIKMDQVKLTAAPAVVLKNKFSPLLDQDTSEAKLLNQRMKNIHRENPTERKPLEIIELDIQGPFKIKAHDGSSSNLKIIDKATGYLKMELIKSKSSQEMKDIFERYHKRMERQSGKTIRRVRTDGDPAFYGQFLAYLESTGIIKEKTPPYIHHLPSTVERSHQTITSMSRISMECSKLPPSFYGFAMEHSVYIYNRTVGSKGKSPFELMFGKKSTKEIIPFGTIGYTFIPLELREYGKLSNRRSKVRMLTFGDDDDSEETFGWQVLDEESGSRFFSNDVVWDYDHPKRPLRNKRIDNSELFILDEVDYNEAAAPILIEDSNSEYSPTTTNTISSHPTSTLTEIPSSATSNISPLPTIPDSEFDLTPEQQAIMDELDARYGDTIFKGLMARYSDLFLGDDDEFEKATDTNQLMSIFYAMHASTSNPAIPKSFKEAMESENKSEWKKAMDIEIASLKRNNTWKLIDNSGGKKTIKCKWVFDIKYAADGSIIKYKARLVAKGFTQKKGIDYTEIFSPVSKITTWRILIALAASKGWDLFQDDVPSAFLKGSLKEEIFMEQPEGYQEGPMVCRLIKTLYGLKQSAREWNEVITNYLISQGFSQVISEPCLFTRKRNGKLIFLVIWVDDILSTGDDDISSFRLDMQNHFGMDKGCSLSWCLGLHVSRDPITKDITMDQDKYVKDKCSEFAKYIQLGGSANPLPSNYSELLKEADNPDAQIIENFPYAPMLGSLMYAMICTRPDLSTAVSILSRYTRNPKKIHCQLIQHTFRYARDNSYAIQYKYNSPLKLEGYVDAAYATGQDCKSISGYVFKLGSGPISWATNKQPIVSLSSSEAEYIAVTPAGQECKWLSNILKAINIPQNSVALYEDNDAVLKLAKEPKINKRTKHIDVRYHWIREQITNGIFKLIYCNTKSQIADMFTKVPPGPQFHKLVKMMGMITLPKHVFSQGGC